MLGIEIFVNFLMTYNNNARFRRFNNRGKIKLGHAVKSNILGEKFNWFTEVLGDRTTPLSNSEFEELITM